MCPGVGHVCPGLWHWTAGVQNLPTSRIKLVHFQYDLNTEVLPSCPFCTQREMVSFFYTVFKERKTGREREVRRVREVDKDVGKE